MLSNLPDLVQQKLQDALNTSKQNKTKIGAFAIVGAILIGYYKTASAKRNQIKKETNKKEVAVTSRRRNVALNREFFNNLKKLLRIVIPGIRSKESFIILLHSFFLIARTVASVYLAVLDGRIVKALVSGDGKQFSMQIALWLVVSIPIAFTNSAIKYLQGKLSIAFRTRLTDYVHNQYMNNYTFYKLENLDSRIKNADQCITQDVAKFCNSLSELYSNLAKPTLDCIIYNAKLAQNVGWKGLIALTLCIHTGTFILRKFTPPFGRLIAEEQRLEGNYRFAHSRVITNAEEIAFYGGSKIEKGFLDQSYKELVRHVNKVLFTRLEYGTIEDYIVKYYWGALGFLICALPVFSPFGKVAASTSLTSRTKDFVTNRRLLLNTSDAFGRIMYSYKEVSELAGFTARVSDMLNVFDDLQVGKYEKATSNAPSDGATASLSAAHGQVIDNPSIKVENLAIVSPGGDILVKDLSFEVPHGTHVLIVGPNGCGKSSLFRILGGLWPVYEGTVEKPFNVLRPETGEVHNQIFYIPQRPYLSTGTLRDQIIYPHTRDEALRNGGNDAALEAILDIVKLRYIVEREGGWDAKADWKDVLSGGEKQRVGMARLFYHKPRYAILDECTSAVSIDVEGIMYEKAKDLGVSLLTVSHRPSLWRYHDYKLEFDGNGGWKFGKIGDQSADADADNSISKMTLEEEKNQLEKRIKVDQQRVKKIVSMLGDDDQ